MVQRLRVLVDLPERDEDMAGPPQQHGLVHVVLRGGACPRHDLRDAGPYARNVSLEDPVGEGGRSQLAQQPGAHGIACLQGVEPCLEIPDRFGRMADTHVVRLAAVHGLSQPDVPQDRPNRRSAEVAGASRARTTRGEQAVELAQVQ
jgi:hypothetical protein